MKVTKLLRRTTSLFLALVMLLSFPVGAYSEGTGSDPEAPEVPEGYVWRTLSVELAPFEEDCLEKEEEEAARMAEKTAEVTRFMELLLSHDAAVAEEEEDDDSEPVIAVRGWMPEDVTAQAELISYADADLYAELAMMQVELRFYDGEGRLWTPAVPVTVFVDGAAVRDARAGEMDPTVYVYREDVEEEELRKQTRRVDEPEERLFSVQAFSAARTGDEEKTYELEEEEVHVDVVERGLVKDDEFPDAVCFETASESLRFAVTARQQDRSFSASTEDGETEIVVMGALPCGLSAQVTQTAVEAETLDLPGELVRSWDLSLTHPEAADYQIDGTVKVALRDAALAEMQDEDWELQLWQLRENDDPVRVKSAAFRGEDLRFSADSLASYAVVRVAVERCLTASDGETYSVRVSYDSYAGIPAGAELQVREILPEDIVYAKYLSKSVECAGQKMADLDFARMFDISLRDPETGVEYQPNQNVKVSIELLSEEVNESTLVDVVHFGQQTEVMGSAVNGEAVAFETKGFSVYVLMGVTLEKTITAADGSSYEVSVTYGKSAGIPSGAELKVRELDGEEYQQYLKKTASFLSRSAEELEYTRFFDITIEKDGVVYEPNEAVTVSVKLMNRPGNRGEVRVVHFGADGTELLENEMNAEGVLEFETNSFSVYAITDESGDVVVPRVWYYFYQYQRGSNGIITEGGKPKYMLTPDEKNGTQIIRTQGKLLEVPNEDFAATNALYFLGWYIWDEEKNKWGEKIEFDTPISVMWGAEGSDPLVYGNSVVVPKEYDAQGKQINQGVKVTVRARYTSDFATIVFYNDTKEGLLIQTTVRVPVPEGETTTVYEIPDVTDEQFTVAPDANHSDFAFYGWNENRATPWENYYSEDNYTTRPPQKTLTVEAHGTYSMYPVFCKGHWVIYHTAPVGSGAGYVKPEFVLTNGRATKPEDPDWRGYAFRFWSAVPTFDLETGEFYQFNDPDQPNYQAEDPANNEYNFNQVVDKTLHLYAVWQAGYSTYNVIVWKQRVEDDRDLPNQRKSYEFDSQYTFDAKVWEEGDAEITLQSSGLDFTKLDTNPDFKDDFVGFHHKSDQNPAVDDQCDTVSARVLGNGTTTLNVYYDRDIIRFKFYKGSAPGPRSKYYTDRPNPEYEAGNGDDAKWGYVNGHYELLTKATKVTGSWTVNGTDVSNATIAGNRTAGYDGKFYTRSGAYYNYSYTATEYTFDNLPPADITLIYYCKYYTYGTNYSNIDWRVARYKETVETEWYTAEGVKYEGTRYKLNSNWFWYTGLYGQNLSKYGYEWPSGHWMVYSNNTPTDDYGLTFMGQFVLYDDVYSYKDRDFRLYYDSDSDAKVYFYLQKEDGSWSYVADATGALTFPRDRWGRITGGVGFKFTDKYDGYDFDSYVITSTSATVNDNTAWIDANVGESVGVYYGQELHIRYTREFYNLSYFDGMDGQPLTVLNQKGNTLQVEEDLRFGETLEKYYPEMDLNKFQVVPKEAGWEYQGRWYADWNPCTTQVLFRSRIDENGKEVAVEEDEWKLWYYVLKDDLNKEHIYVGHVPTEEEKALTDRDYDMDPCVFYTTMPNRNLAIYAGFTHPWYWIKIDPNGGELNWLTEDGKRNTTQSTYFWEQYGAEIKEYTVTRNFVKDRNYGEFYYHYDEFNSNEPEGEQPATRLAYYTDDPGDPLLTEAEKRTKYGKTGSGNAFKLIGWFKVDESAPAGQQLKRYDFANETVTGNLILRAMWRQEGDIYVYYSTDHAVNANGAVVNGLTLHGEALQDLDSNGNYVKYQDNSSVMVPVGDGENQTTLYATDADNNRYELVGWFYQSQVTPAGGIFHTSYDLDQHPVIDADNPRRPFDTVILYPVFRTGGDEGSGGNETALILDANGGRRNENFDQLDPNVAQYSSDGTQVRYIKKLLLNMDINLPISLPGNDVFIKDKAELLGWAANKDAKQPTFTAKQLVGVDNSEGGGFDGVNGNILYAVWHVSELSVKVHLIDTASQPISGAKFTLDSVTGNLVSNDTGWLAQGDEIVFNLKTPDKPGDPAKTYVLSEIETATGYIPLPAPVSITIDYYGNFDVEYATDAVLTEQEEKSLNVMNVAVGEYTITIIERPAVCKVARNGTEKLFDSLNAAVDYIGTGNTGTIEMVRDYKIPYEDIVGVDAGTNITLTTAAKGVKYPYIGDGETATITRAENSPSLFTVNGSFSLNNIILDGANDKFSGKTDGGLICVNNGGKLSVGTGTTLQNSTDDTKGGAIYLAPGAEATVTACTITGNKAADGAGIYVSANAKLNISGSINFGGSSITAGNFSTNAISGESPKNATQDYPYGRQDIYLAESEDAPTSLYVTGELTGGDGTIWVWAESEKHYGMNKDFALVTSPALLTEATMHAFRNAREDAVTGCGSEYLTGQVGSQQMRIAWTGGINVNFKKTDGFGEKLEGAKFTLFTDLACTEFVMNQGERVTATSNENGVVTFEAVSNGVYYLMETVSPDGYEENTYRYILLVGKDYVTVPTDANKITGVWANVLRGITQEQIDAQRTAYNEVFNNTELYGDDYKRDETNYVIFRLEENADSYRYSTIPDIARKGIVNFSSVKRPVILSKVSPVLMPLAYGKFRLLSVDGSEIKNENLLDSDASGVFFAGVLSVGTYLLEETAAPYNPKNSAESYTKPDHYFVFQVTESGIMALKKGQDDEESFALTNTITVATSDEYKIPENS